MFSDDNIWPLKLWLFLAALNGNDCGVSSVGRISCSLTQPLCLPHAVRPWLIRQLPMHTHLGLILDMVRAHPKPWDPLGAAEAFLNLSAFIMAKLFCMCVQVAGRGGGPGGGSIKTSCGCFYQLNPCKYTCALTQCKLLASLAVLGNTQTCTQIRECRCSAARCTYEFH